MRRSNVWTCLFLSSLMAGCSSTEYVHTREYVYVDLPARYLADCPATPWVEGGTYRQLGKLAASLRADLNICNAQLREARDFQREEAAKRAVTQSSE